MTIELFIGIVAILLGFYTLILRFKNPAQLGKLATMKTVFGERVGGYVHLIAYSIMPIIFGLAILMRFF